jgi:hypothetical protein
MSDQPKPFLSSALGGIVTVLLVFGVFGGAFVAALVAGAH